MTRVSIKSHHDQYLKNLAAQMNCDIAEALNYLLFEVRRTGFSFTSPLTLSTPAPQPPQPPESIGAFVRYEELAPTLPETTPSTDSEFDDEIIQKFAALLEEF